MVFLQNIWWYLVLIGVMILIHELGHYWAARFFDVKVDTFSFGFGPRLFGFRRGETDFRFSAILFGGYVKMAGEQPGDENSADPRGFMSKPRWQRLIIAFAGPAINIVLAIVLLTGLFMQHYPKVPTPINPVVGYVVPEGVAAKAGIREGDQVVQIDSKESPNWEDVMLKEVASAHQPMQIWVMRQGERLHFTVTPEERQGLGSLGWAQETDVQIASIVRGMEAEKAGLERGDILVSVNGIPLRSISRLYEVERDTDGKPLDLVYLRPPSAKRAASGEAVAPPNSGVIGERHEITVTPVKRDPDGQGPHWMIGLTVEGRVDITKLPLHEALYEATRRNMQFAQLIFKFLDGIVERRMSPKSIEGPIRIAQLSGEAAREGAASFFELMAGVSLNLAIFNLLPIPILDGGVMLMLLVEMLMRRDLDLKVKEAVLKVGIVFLMVVVVFVIYNDISKILPPG